MLCFVGISELAFKKLQQELQRSCIAAVYTSVVLSLSSAQSFLPVFFFFLF